MKKIFLAGSAALLLGLFAPNPHTVYQTNYPLAMSAEGVDGMAQMRLTLKKLQDAMMSMKDFDDLEASGMPKENVDRMRRAMQIKINQMMEDVIKDIHAL